MSRIDLQIVGTANFAQLESALGRVKAQLASINAMRMTGPIGPGVQSQLDAYLKTFRETIDASGMYERHVVNMTNETEKFGRSLERGNLRLGQLYRTALEYRRSEMGQIRQLAREQIRMQNAVAVARNATTADVFVPRGIDEGIEKNRILSQEYRILKQVISNGSTELINWGKNTQWAGRQLTVGLTVPITMFGAAAAKAFMDADKQLTRLTKVYGDAAKGIVSASELSSIRQEAVALSRDIASSMGVSVTETLGVAADIAATGKEGNDLLSATREAMRLSVLGEVDRQEAMRATLAIQTVFKQSTQGLTDSINFLNAVENQTSTSLNDLVTGIVKAGPVVQGLGGSIEDLSLMLVAMREGGVPASEAANAIKSSLGALINPTKQTTQVLSEFGIDLKNIVDTNAGNVIGTLMDLQSALEGLNDLSRQRAIEQIFGKFQFARINALLSNLNKAGSQTEQVMKLAALGTTQLAETADRELSAVTESVTGRFQRAFETLKANLIPIGETFAEVGTLLLNVGNKILEVFNSLPDPVKNFFKFLTMGTAVIGPLIMITGVLGNFFGYLVKGISTLMLFKKAGREAFSMLGPESAAVKDATEQLTESLFNQTTAVETMESAIDRLILKLEELQRSMRQTASTDVLKEGQVLSGAEARALPSTMYTTPQIPFELRSGRKGEIKYGENIQYSHLIGEAKIRNILKQQGMDIGTAVPLGMGSFVEGLGADVQSKLNEAFIPDFSALSEEILTDETRKTELKRLARERFRDPSGITAEFTQLADMIDRLSSDQLSQLLPSWEKLSAQTIEYMGTLKTAAEGVQSVDEGTRARVTQALEKFKAESLADPAGALTELRSELKKAGLSIDKWSNEISNELQAIYQEASQAATPEARAAKFEELITSRIVSPYEVESMKSIQAAGVTGFEKRSGFQYVVMAGAQKLSDEMMNQVNMSVELRTAYERAIRSKNSLREAEERYAQSISDSMLSQERVDTANERLATILEKRKMSDDFTRGEDGSWLYKTGKQATGTELIAALDAREAALLQATQADINYSTSLDQLNDAKDRNRQTSEMLVQAQEQEILASKENIIATEKDTAETIQAAQAENQQEISAKKNVVGTDKDTVETLQAANAENVQESAALKNAAATDADTGATGGGIGGALGKGSGKLSMLGAGIGSVLSMATMFMPTGDNKTLNTATDILGGAGMGASMGGMFGAPGAIIGGLLGAAIPAVSSFIAASDETTKKLTQYSEALGGSSVVIDRFAQEMGKLKPSEQLTAAIGQISTPEKVIQEGGSLLETEAGKQLLDLSRQFSGTQLVDALRAQLQQLTLLEIFTPDQAKSVAQALALELGQPMLGQALVDGINSVLDSEGKLMQDRVAELFAGTIPEFNFGSMPDVLTATGPRGGYVTNLDELRQWAMTNVGGIVSNLDKLREAQALTTKEFMSGNITYEEYNDQMSKIRNQNVLAADALYRLKDAGINVTDALVKVAEAGGIVDQFKAAENAAKELMGTLTDASGLPILGTEDTSKFYTQIQVAAAYGDITESDVRTLLQLIQDPTQKANISAIFSVEGAQENATEIIKLINSGMDTEFIMKITSNADEVGVPLNDLYASLVAISTLPTEIQKKVVTDISNSPQLLDVFIQNYEYAMSLPDSQKELKAEVFGNDQLEFFQDNWQSFINLPEEERKRAIFEYMITGNYEFTAPVMPTPTAVTELMSPNISEMMQVFSGGGGSGGGSSDAISKAFDKKIKQQDQIIKQIQKEREERQKLLDLEKRALDFAMQQQDLENQIMIAKSEGRIADAALLQSQLDATRITEREDEKERLRQEAEDRRIKKAEREKKRLEREKQKATESAGGGGGGGISDAESNRIERSLQFLNDQLNAALLNNTEILDQIAEKGGDAFWKSEAVKKYKDAVVALGIPLDIVNKQLEGVYDELVNKGFGEQGIRQFDRMRDALIEVGISGETLNNVLPDVFGILSDPEITRSKAIQLITQAFIKAGDSAEVATERAKNFLRASGQRVRFTSIEDFNDQLDTLINDKLTKDQGEKISKEFAEGMKNGLTSKQILDNIYTSIYEDTLKKALDDGFNADAAARKAEEMATSVKNTLTNQFDQFKVTIGSEFDASGLPEFMRGAFTAAENAGIGKGETGTMGTPTWSVSHTVTSNVQLAQGATSNNPLYVNVVNQTNNGGGSSPTTKEIDGRTYYWNGSRWVLVPGAATGGLIKHFSNGSFGSVRGPGGPTDDLIPAMLSNGEYVIRASSVDKYGIPFMDMINKGTFQLMASGGYSKYPSMVARMGGGGYAMRSYASGGLVPGSNVEYNINVNVEGSNASADEIAGKVMQAMQRRENMRGTNTRI